MKAETLKKIAEYMGYEVRLTELFEPVTANDELCLKGTQVRYNPLTNNDQMVEIMEKLKMDVYHYPDEDYCWKALVRRGKQQEGLTINEAVLNAASELVKDK